jgi:hypothetical protein
MMIPARRIQCLVKADRVVKAFRPHITFFSRSDTLFIAETLLRIPLAAFRSYMIVYSGIDF